MSERDWLEKRFSENRVHLRRVAHRMLGSATEAEDAVQEAWIRVARSDAAGIENWGGWLTTIVARVCLDMLRSRGTRREVELGTATAGETSASDPESDALLASSLGPALLIVLETLAPAERVAFVLHDMFDLSFEEIAGIVGRSPAAARQLASRARRRVQGGAAPGADVAQRREVVDAFLAASRDGNFESLVAVLAPDVVFRADEHAIRLAEANKWGGGGAAPGLASEVRGARAVAELFKGRARGARPALINGAPGAVWTRGRELRAAFLFTVERDKVTTIEVIVDPGRLDELDVESTKATT
jgi:RNA polymerase sigma-70 factor (ECF subfamily)